MTAIDIDEYESRGFVIVRGIFSGERLRALRCAADDLVAAARAHADLSASRRIPLTDPRLIEPGCALLDAIADDTVVAVSETIQRSRIVGNVYNINVDSLDQYWHRDELFLPKGFRWDVQGYREERPFSQIQWNVPLADDDYLHVVPSSHRGELSETQRATMERSQREKRFAPEMPGELCVRLRAGDGVAYNSNLLHGVLRPAHQPVRRTLHWYWVREGHADPYQPAIPDTSVHGGRLHPRLRAAYDRVSPDARASRFHLG